ncbi:MAG: hypothetical protein RR813_06955 [Enterococcus sp.]|jgi:hypothetical protein|nr:hypothetical protein [Enterococcus dispar]OJG39737.1 hypothetical protein RV01_GL000919 [Enterococcus dispar]
MREINEIEGNNMTKKHRLLIALITVLTLFHMVFCAFYSRLYGYFNLHDNLQSFLTTILIIRGILLGGIAFAGFISLKDESRKTTPFYLIFFLFNLIIPFVFN